MSCHRHRVKGGGVGGIFVLVQGSKCEGVGSGKALSRQALPDLVRKGRQKLGRDDPSPVRRVEVGCVSWSYIFFTVGVVLWCVDSAHVLFQP